MGLITKGRMYAQEILLWAAEMIGVPPQEYPSYIIRPVPEKRGTPNS